MKAILFLILFTSFTNLSAQGETITMEDICRDVYFETPPDSTYDSYYIKNLTDTIYFRKNFCVIHHLITSPYGISLFHTLEGAAEGVMEWHMRTSGDPYVMIGNFEKGRFMDGTWVSYYKNGNIRNIGQYINGARAGKWKFYKENGCLDFEGICEDGICFEIEK